MVDDPTLEQRAAVHAALGEPSRLAIVDQLASSDRSPQELQEVVGVPSNLLAHHLDVLEAAGLIERSRSSGDGRRRYVHLIHAGSAHLGPRARRVTGPVLFVCTANSARSQLAAGLWTATTGAPARQCRHPPGRAGPPRRRRRRRARRPRPRRRHADVARRGSVVAHR